MVTQGYKFHQKTRHIWRESLTYFQRKKIISDNFRRDSFPSYQGLDGLLYFLRVLHYFCSKTSVNINKAVSVRSQSIIFIINTSLQVWVWLSLLSEDEELKLTEFKINHRGLLQRILPWRDRSNIWIHIGWINNINTLKGFSLNWQAEYLVWKMFRI